MFESCLFHTTSPAEILGKTIATANAQVSAAFAAVLAATETVETPKTAFAVPNSAFVSAGSVRCPNHHRKICRFPYFDSAAEYKVRNLSMSGCGAE